MLHLINVKRKIKKLKKIFYHEYGANEVNDFAEAQKIIVERRPSQIPLIYVDQVIDG